MSTHQPIRLLFRTKESVQLHTLPPTSLSSPPASNSTSARRELHRGKCAFHVLSPSAAYVRDAAAGLIKIDLNDPDPRAAAPFPEGGRSVQLAKLSPRFSYLVTWQRPEGGADNLRVWDARSGELLKSFSCKKATLETLQWTHDEELAFHMVTDEIHVYRCDREGWERAGRVRCPDVSSFSLPQTRGRPKSAPPETEKKYPFAVFRAGGKNRPAGADLLRHPDRLGRDSAPSGPALCSKSLFDAEEASFRWSPRADSALLTTQTAVDATGQSYYGSTRLFLMLEEDPKNPDRGSVAAVPLPPEASRDASGEVPVVSASWVPNPLVSGAVPFAVISGKMPALASLHHGTSGEPTFLFGRGHRNCLDVSPHGRFVALGGYGNLAGGMDFWDRNKGKRIPRHVLLGGSEGREGKYATIGDGDLSVASPAPVVGHQWSPDSRTYMVSTTSPRMNVENGVRVYRYDGTLLTDLPWDNEEYRPDGLLSAEYVPAPVCEDEEEYFYYPDRPASPPPRGLAELKGEAAARALEGMRRSSAPSSEASPPAARGGAYVPPAARGGAYVPPGARAGRGGTLAERMRREREGSAAALAGKKVVRRTGPPGSASAGPVGSAPNDPDAKSKSAARREKQRLAKENAEREAEEAERRKKEEEAARAEANKADPEKRAKKIKKTLKQIEEIREKEKEGAELNEDQRRKLESEEGLRKELADLGL